MTQQVFLKQLETQLRKRFPEARAEEILNDYKEYFEDGLAEGCREEELCEKFGNPKDIVSELCSEGMGSRKSLLNLGMKIISWSFLFLLLIILRVPGYWMWASYDIVRWQIGLIILLPVIQMFLQGKQKGAQNLPSLGKGRISVLAVCSMAGLVLLGIQVFTLIYVALHGEMWIPLLAEQISPFCVFIGEIGIVFALAAWGFSLYWDIRKLLWLMLFNAGIVSAMMGSLYLMMVLSDPKGIILGLIQMLYPFWISLILTMISFIYKKGGKRND